MNSLRAYLVQTRDALLSRRAPASTNDITPHIPALESCLTHTFLMQAADRQVPLDGIRVDVLSFEELPHAPSNIQYTVRINSPASDAELMELHEAVEEACTVLAETKLAQPLSGSLVRTEGLTVNSVTVGTRTPALV